MSDRSDGIARLSALDPERSFIVEAPAGSGKTELLIQRYLKLLLCVEEPEQVVAVTFTRKAAAEMRARVFEMLRAARDGASLPEAHRALTLQLAGAVIDRDTELRWALLNRPGRIRIDTVDALNAWLADRLPLLAGGVAGGAVVEDPESLYIQVSSRAVMAALSEPALRPCAQRMLESADNSLETLIRALAAILPLRDQWLGLMVEADFEELRDALLVRTEMTARLRLESLLGELAPGIIGRLESVLRHAAAHSDDYAILLAGAGSLSADTKQDIGGQIQVWQCAARLLLTNSGQWRKRFTRNEGFLPGHKEAKKALADLVAELESNEAARRKLGSMLRLPPLLVSDDQLARAVAAREILRRAVAELKIRFQQDGVVDFLELALGAQQALGSVDAPSDLLLALDRRIEHLLVDEFQDTSHSQFRLLELLTAGWSDGDGRTLFLVGDPMQSIYRFRNADMSLFLKARNGGLGNVRLSCLTLQSNFRSSPGIVDWVNATFDNIFPQEDDPETGAARYSPFRAALERRDGDGVTVHRMPSADLAAQHRRVAAIAAAELDRSNDGTIAVLVQSRSHLAGLREVLQLAGVRTRAVELDTLAGQPVVQDMLALTRALLHSEDHIAWLALLRAPWCGLTWSELHSFCSDDRKRPVLELLNEPGRIDRIEDMESRRRAEFVRDRLAQGLQLRGRYGLARWVECCWQLLDGPACLKEPQQIHLVRRYLETLAKLSVDGDVDDPASLDRAFEIPFESASGSIDGNALEIMTIHRAKGLEFDSVVLFGLERRVRPPAARAIYWQETPAGLLYAPLSTKRDQLADYLRSIDRELDEAERARLLYVAVTRARRRLHLIGYVDEPERGRRGGAPAGSLMACVAGQFKEVAAELPDDSAADAQAFEWIVPGTEKPESVTAVPLGPLASTEVPAVAERSAYEWASPAAAHIGTVVHRALQKAGSGSVEELRLRLGLDSANEERYRGELRLLGVPPVELDAAARRVHETLERVLDDSTGAWILSDHEGAESELEITVSQTGEPAHMRLDRTFLDESGVRWIVDYKTSLHGGGDVESFLDAEVERYRDQLDAYAGAMHEIEGRPVRVALYFPMLRALREWVPAVCAEGRSGPGT